MSLKEIISKNLKSMREKYQLTQEEFARRAGMHQRSYGRLESGEMWQHLESLEKISKAYHIDLAMLLNENGVSEHPLDALKPAFNEANEMAQNMVLSTITHLKNNKKDVKDEHYKTA